MSMVPTRSSASSSHGWRDEDAETCRLSLDIVRRTGERRHLSLHVGHYALLQSHRSEYRAACRTAEEGLRLAVEVRDAYQYMTAQFYHAWALLHLGQWGELRRVLRDGLEMAERNGHHLWARAFRFHTAWLLTQAGDFARARALCERERQPGEEVQLGENLGSIVLGFANVGLSRFPEALRAFKEVTGRLESGRVLMDWILNLPLRLGLGEYWLVRRQFGRAREQMQELCRLAAAPGERTYLALGHQGLAEATLGEGDRAKAEREVAEALGVLDGIRGAAGGVASLRHGRARRGSARPPVESGGLLGPRRRRARSTGNLPKGRRRSVSILPGPTSGRGRSQEREGDGRHCATAKGTAPGRAGRRSGSSQRHQRPS